MAPSARLWRGVGSEGGSGFATYGRGLYFTADRRVATEYAGDDGQIIEIPRAYLPDNALRFDTTNDFQIWKQRAYKLLGFGGPQEFAAAYDDLGSFIRSLDPTIDGIQMFTGKDAIFVLYTDDELNEEAPFIEVNIPRIIQLIDDQDGLNAFPNDDDDDGIWHELLNIEIDSATKLAKQSALNVYRVMQLDESDLTRLAPGASLGFFWALRPDINTADLLAQPNVLFVGEVSGQVNIEETVAQNYIFPEEHEVVFAPDAPVRLTGIFELGSKKPLRQDLWGKMFKVSNK